MPDRPVPAKVQAAVDAALDERPPESERKAEAERLERKRKGEA